jgi:hypothetical protein
MTGEPLTVAELENWLAQFPPQSLVHASEGELVVVTGNATSMTLHPLATPTCPP